MKMNRIFLTLLLSISTFFTTAYAIETKEMAQKYEGIDISVNVNVASADEIAMILKGVGKKKAQRIVDFREAHGEFKTIDELTQVKGIGHSTIAKNKQRIILQDGLKQ